MGAGNIPGDGMQLVLEIKGRVLLRASVGARDGEIKLVNPEGWNSREQDRIYPV